MVQCVRKTHYGVRDDNKYGLIKTSDLEKTNLGFAPALVWLCWIDGLCSTVPRLILFGLVSFRRIR